MKKNYFRIELCDIIHWLLAKNRRADLFYFLGLIVISIALAAFVSTFDAVILLGGGMIFYAWILALNDF